MVVLYDAGTETDEPPGGGPNQAPRQPASDTGPDEHGKVGPAGKRFAFPPVAAVIRLTVEPVETGAEVTG